MLVLAKILSKEFSSPEYLATNASTGNIFGNFCFVFSRS
jgi:hypothetical protein